MDTRNATTQNEVVFFILKNAIVHDLRNLIKEKIVPHIRDETGNASKLITNNYSLEQALITYKNKCDDSSLINSENIKESKVSDLNLLVECTSFLDAFKIPLSKQFINHTPTKVKIFLKEYSDVINDIKKIRNDIDHETKIEPQQKEIMIQF